MTGIARHTKSFRASRFEGGRLGVEGSGKMRSLVRLIA